MEQKHIDLSQITQLLENNNKTHLKGYIYELHPADIAEIITNLEEEEYKISLFKLLHPQQAIEVMEELDYDQRLYILSNIKPQYAAYLLREMAADEVADFIGDLPPNSTGVWLDNLEKETREEIKKLLKYPPETAGGIMTTEYVAFFSELKIKDVMEKLPELAPTAETIYYIYVIDDKNTLVGVVSLRDLILADPDSTLKEIMSTDVKKVYVDTDQEEVVMLMDKYGFLGLPVVDNKDRLLGIVTVDDAMDVLTEETSEDIYKLAGHTEYDDTEKMTTWRRAYKRLPWLLVALFGEMISGKVIHRYSDALEAIVALAFFVPILMDMGGNVGTQSSAIMVRGIATGQINPYKILQNIAREGLVGIILGIICGAVVAIVATIWQGVPEIGLVVGISMALSLVIAAVMGSLTPLVLNRLGKDPAVASGPFVTTSLDIVGLFIYFSSATVILRNI